ncbi:hypothetical protein WJX72_005659 [[Myrmecia] bisecta]|uniref:Uncharacterized protein n=1 Tax=[Myrmecia] bisecta TaxID=41462 RepID=A0AAW1R6Q7_9CHLO
MASAAAVAPGEQQAPPQDDDSLDQHRRSLQRSLEQHYSRPDEHLQHRSPSYMRESFAPMNTHHMHSVKPARAQHKAPDRQQSETMNEMRNRLIARMQQANEAKMRVDDRKRQTKRTTKPATLQLPSAFEPAVWKCSISPNSSPKAAENRERARAYADTLKASRSLPASRDHTPKKLRDAGPAGPAATHLAASLPATPRQDRPGWGSQRKPQRLTRQVSQPRHTFDWEKELRSPRMPSPNKPLTGWETNEPDQGPMMFRRGWTPDRAPCPHLTSFWAASGSSCENEEGDLRAQGSVGQWARLSPARFRLSSSITISHHGWSFRLVAAAQITPPAAARPCKKAPRT